MGTEELEKHIESLENQLQTARRKIEELNELEQNGFKMPILGIQNVSDEEIGQRCKRVSYFNAATMMSKQFGASVSVPVEFASRSLAELVYRCTDGVAHE